MSGKPLRYLAIVILASVTPFPAFAGNDQAIVSRTVVADRQSEATTMTAGEVKKIDAEQGKVTIKHGPLDNLGMPGMTMVFRVANPAMLTKIKTGDAIRFRADKLNGAFTIVDLLPGA